MSKAKFTPWNKPIEEVADVVDFFHHLIHDCGVSIQIDDDFKNFSKKDGTPTFTEGLQISYNQLLKDCKYVCKEAKVNINELNENTIVRTYTNYVGDRILYRKKEIDLIRSLRKKRYFNILENTLGTPDEVWLFEHIVDRKSYLPNKYAPAHKYIKFFDDGIGIAIVNVNDSDNMIVLDFEIYETEDLEIEGAEILSQTKESTGEIVYKK